MVVPPDVNRINGAAVSLEFGPLITRLPLGDGGAYGTNFVNDTRTLDLNQITDPTMETVALRFRLTGRIENPEPLCAIFSTERPDGSLIVTANQSCIGTPQDSNFEWWNWVGLGAVWTGKPQDINMPGLYKTTVTIVSGQVITGHYDFFFEVTSVPTNYTIVVEESATGNRISGFPVSIDPPGIGGVTDANGEFTVTVDEEVTLNINAGPLPGWITLPNRTAQVTFQSISFANRVDTLLVEATGTTTYTLIAEEASTGNRIQGFPFAIDPPGISGATDANGEFIVEEELNVKLNIVAGPLAGWLILPDRNIQENFSSVAIADRVDTLLLVADIVTKKVEVDVVNSGTIKHNFRVTVKMTDPNGNDTGSLLNEIRAMKSQEAVTFTSNDFTITMPGTWTATVQVFDNGTLLDSVTQTFNL